MKILGLFKLIVLTNVFASNFTFSQPVKANTFDEASINSNQIIAVAAPYRHGYNLVVIEQIEGKKSCWSEQGSYPTRVEPLLMNFDFTGHCRRATDANGYSIRMNDREYASDYLLNVIDAGNELHLVASHRDPNKPKLTIGKTHGKTDGLTKFFLSPGWNFTKRSYQGQAISHFYFSKGATAIIGSTQLKIEEDNRINESTTASANSVQAPPQQNTGSISTTITNQNQNQQQEKQNGQSTQPDYYRLF